jgi:hypothetical protein
VIRRLALLVGLLLCVAAPAAAQLPSAGSQTERLALTAVSDHCAGGLPVVDYTVTNLLPAAVSVQTWWVADASVYGLADAFDLEPAPDSATGSFNLPYSHYATVTVFATALWPDGQRVTNASWAIPVAGCTAAPPPTTGTPPTTVAEPTTTVGDDDPGNGRGNGNGNGHGHAPTTTEPAALG